MSLNLILFSLTWIIIVYLFNCVVAKEWKRVQWPRAFVYITTVAMLGLYGEIFVDTIYNHFFGTPLWRYNFMPIHGGYTSTFAVVLWGVYGFYLYLLHDSLKIWSAKRENKLVLLFSIEALIIEALVVISSKWFLGEYIYYYYPEGLWHVSAFQNIPFYFICGLLIVKSVKRFLPDPKFFIFLNSWLIVMVLLFL